MADCSCQPPPKPDAPSGAGHGVATTRSRYLLPGMDCPSEEQMVRLQLAEHPDVAALRFDLGERILTVHHRGDPHEIAGAIAPLGFGHTLLDSHASEEAPAPERGERTVLWQLLVINALMFVIEILAGWIAESTGLLADGLDMLADAAVYALALFAVGAAAGRKLRTAHLSGWLQLILGIGILIEVARRIWIGATPEPPIMLGIALLALAANVMCVVLLARHRDGAAHMKASWIFTANDALANLGVILAGALVAWLNTPWPDWVIGTAIAGLILHGAWRILRLRA